MFFLGEHLELSQGLNPGKEKAGEAADAVNGFIVLPTFAPGEQPINPKHFSYFNDLAKNSKLSIEGVKRQIKPKIDRISKRYNCLHLSQKSNVVRMV